MLRNRTSVPAAKLPALKAFDDSSGQVYTEQFATARTRHHSDWIGELRTPSLVKKTGPNRGHGARSLVDAAIIKTAADLFRELSSEHFGAIPWALAERIWHQVLEAHRESFHTWRVLAAAYPDQMADQDYRYYLHFRQPSLPLVDYFKGLTSNDWLTCLRISPKETRTADLVNVSTVSNLAVLDLSDGQITIDKVTSPFGERVMRTWAELADAGHAFQHLYALFLGWQNLDLWLFQYLPHFPRLKKVIITDSPKLHQKNRKEWETVAQQYGWDARHAKRSAKSLRPVFDEARFHRCAVSGILFEGDISKGNQDGHVRLHKLPVVETCLGLPKKWTHILDDFPGTRTIFLDRVKLVGGSLLTLKPEVCDSGGAPSNRPGRAA